MIDQFGNWRADFPGQQPYMDPQFVRMYGPPPAQGVQQPTAQPQQPAAAPAMTPPTIHAEIVQVEGEVAATQYPVGVGASQMMMARDESAIYVKTATSNGYTLDVFVKRPPAPEAAPFNPADYVRIDALPGLIATEVQTALASMQPAKQARRKNETEGAE